MSESATPEGVLPAHETVQDTGPLGALDGKLDVSDPVNSISYLPARHALRRLEVKARELVFSERQGTGDGSIPVDGFSDPFPIVVDSSTNQVTVETMLADLGVDIERWAGPDQRILEALEPHLQVRKVRPFGGGEQDSAEGSAASVGIKGVDGVRLEVIKTNGVVGGNYLIGLSLNRAGFNNIASSPNLPPVQH